MNLDYFAALFLRHSDWSTIGFWESKINFASEAFEPHFRLKQSRFSWEQFEYRLSSNLIIKVGSGARKKWSWEFWDPSRNRRDNWRIPFVLGWEALLWLGCGLDCFRAAIANDEKYIIKYIIPLKMGGGEGKTYKCILYIPVK